MTAVSKVTLNGTTLMDATTATATASEIIAPYTAMTADGVMTVGTGGGGGGTTMTLTNLFSGSTPLITGYLVNNGSISSPGAQTKEVTTDYLDISNLAGKQLYFFYELSTSNVPWMGMCFYDSSKSLLGSRQVIFEVNGSGLSNGTGIEILSGVNVLGTSKLVAVTSSTKYLRVSFRTWGNAKVCAVLVDTLDPTDYWTRDVEYVAFVDAIESDGTAT